MGRLATACERLDRLPTVLTGHFVAALAGPRQGRAEVREDGRGGRSALLDG